uniref:Uncharacterized protein n=1 Tax=Siphoviridae sp. ctGuJ10 TaxID=2825418 RepID=A0A8S5PSI9_9CAUD|nr:MAG TPA: hypothetical protein [Siphoviridae sp. ctGuJ10]
MNVENLVKALIHKELKVILINYKKCNRISDYVTFIYEYKIKF